MDPGIKLKRHSELWEAGNKTIRRTIVSGLIFAAVVLFNVLEPYEGTAENRKTLRGLVAEQASITSQLADLAVLEEKLQQIQSTVNEAPWNQHKDALILRFREGRVRDALAEGNSTIKQIADGVRGDVVQPLEDLRAGAGAFISETLAKQTEKMGRAIDDWEARNLDKDWFRTVEAKGQTVDDLTTTVSQVQSEALAAVKELQKAMARKQEELTAQKTKVEDAVEANENQIQIALDGAIPVWAKGLVSVELMVQIYPLVLIGIGVYLLGSALVVANHYQEMAEGQGWSQEERSDPVLSSLWTLTYRGRTGTAMTVLSYLAVLLSLWFCLYRGLESVGDEGILATVQWLPHVLMFLAVSAVVAKPLRRPRA